MSDSLRISRHPFTGAAFLALNNLGSDTDPKYDGADGFSLPDLDETNDVYCRPEDPPRV